MYVIYKCFAHLLVKYLDSLLLKQVLFNGWLKFRFTCFEVFLDLFKFFFAYYVKVVFGEADGAIRALGYLLGLDVRFEVTDHAKGASGLGIDAFIRSNFLEST